MKKIFTLMVVTLLATLIQANAALDVTLDFTELSLATLAKNDSEHFDSSTSEVKMTTDSASLKFENGYTLTIYKGDATSYPYIRIYKYTHQLSLPYGSKIKLNAPSGTKMHYVYLNSPGQSASGVYKYNLQGSIVKPSSSTLNSSNSYKGITTLDITPCDSFIVTNTNKYAILNSIQVTDKCAPNKTVKITSQTTSLISTVTYTNEATAKKSPYLGPHTLKLESEGISCNHKSTISYQYYYRLNDDEEYRLYDSNNRETLDVGSYHISVYTTDGSGTYTNSEVYEVYATIVPYPELTFSPEPGSYDEPQYVVPTVSSTSDSTTYTLIYYNVYSDGTRGDRDTINMGDTIPMMMTGYIYYYLRGSDNSSMNSATDTYTITEQNIALTPEPGTYEGTVKVVPTLRYKRSGVTYEGRYYLGQYGAYKYFTLGDTIEIPYTTTLNIAFYGSDNSYCVSSDNSYIIDEDAITLAKLNKYTEGYTGEVTVADDLLIVKHLCDYSYKDKGDDGDSITVYGVALIVRDMGDNTSIEATSPNSDQIDYIVKSTKLVDKNYTWQQNNWAIVYLESTNQEDLGNKFIEGNIIKGGTLNCWHHTSSTSKNYIYYYGYYIWADKMPTIEEAGESVSYNTYIACNFLPTNTNYFGSGATGTDGKNYFFMNPKMTELVHVEWAQYDATNSCFIVPNGENDNKLGFDGYIDYSWDMYWDPETGATMDAPTLEDGKVYSFDAVVKLGYYSIGGGDMKAPKRVSSLSSSSTSTPYYLLLPVTTPTSPEKQTDVPNITTTREIESVKYYNIAGQSTTTPQPGVNIVVTRYSDGTTSTTKKVIR